MKNNMDQCASPLCIAVHIGAGYHSKDKDKCYRKICANACNEGMKLLYSGQSAVDCATNVIANLEDHSFTNAGYGSNLNSNGLVECDAALMGSKNMLFGAVGAVKNFRNPIRIAQSILYQQTKEQRLGLIPPMLIVGEGAEIWAKGKGFQQTEMAKMISENSKNVYEYSKLKLNSMESHAQDTIGAICIDSNGDLASACSSGGLILKHPGRVGQAATYGCGVWAQKQKNTAVGVTTTGCGEHLIRTLLAKEMADALLNDEDVDIIRVTMDSKFINAPSLEHVPNKLGGVLVLKSQEHFIDVIWSFTTASMCVGYCCSSMTKPKTFVSRSDRYGTGKPSLCIEGTTLRF